MFQSFLLGLFGLKLVILSSGNPPAFFANFLFSVLLIVCLGQLPHVLHSFLIFHLFVFFPLFHRRVSQVSANLCAGSSVSAILLLVSTSFSPLSKCSFHLTPYSTFMERVFYLSGDSGSFFLFFNFFQSLKKIFFK